MTTDKILFLPVLLLLITGYVSSPALGLEATYMVTYGANARTIEGDDDFLQVIFIRVPESLSDTLYFRIFDADCGGNLDARYTKEWDTHTRFQLFGGKGAYSNPRLRQPTPDKADLNSGVLLQDKSFGEDLFLDSRWHIFAKALPKKGEKIGKFVYFKLVVQGEEGDDGNRFSIAVSRSPRRNLRPSGLSIFSYAPSVHLPRSDVFAEMRFSVPKDEKEIIAHNFDSSQAFIGVDTAFRSNLPVKPSGQDEWMESSVSLNKDETGRTAALRFAGGEEIPNDGTFYVTDKQGKLLPIQLPVYLHKPNSLPETHINIELLGDCNSFLFDGSRTVDPDGDALSFSWDFGDGKTGKGQRITHQYESPGQYKASVVVEDASGQVSNSVVRRFTVSVNHPPKADAGPDIVAAPRERLMFSGSGSLDPDGEPLRYIWDFGDGNRAQGEEVRHTYRRPDIYVVTLRVEDNSGSPCSSATDECEVWINARPVVNIGRDRIASVGEMLDFSSDRAGDSDGDSDGELASYEWEMGDGAVKTGPDVIYAYDAPGIYKVRLVITDNSGASNSTAADTLEVFVNDPPVADTGGDHQASANEPVLFDGSASFDPDGELIEFIWDFGDGTVSTYEISNSKFETVTHEYESPGEYHVTLTVKDNSGSSSDTDKDETIVIINYPPIADAGEDQWVTSSEVRFDGTASSDEDGDIIEYLWDFGDGAGGKGDSPVHAYGTPGAYSVRLTVTDNSETSTNQTSDEITVIVNRLPIADAGPDRVGAPGQVFSFDASGSVDPDGEISMFQWDLGDGTQSSKFDVLNSDFEKISHSYAKPGKYNVMLTVYDHSGHEGAFHFDKAVVVINESPVAIADCQLPSKNTRPAAANRQSSVIILAPGDNIRLDGSRSYDPDGKIISYQWEFSNAACEKQKGRVFKCRTQRLGLSEDQSSEAPHSPFRIPRSAFQCTFSEPGVYAAMLTVIDNNRVQNSAAQDEVFIRVNHQPVARAGKHIYTNERTIMLDASDSSDADGDPLIHIWDFGDKSPPGRGEKVFHTYTQGGNYPVILTVDDGTGLKNARSASSIRAKLNDAPVANAGEDITVCAGKIAIFDGAGSTDPEGGPMKYHWNFGDDSAVEGVNPTKIYTDGGVYPVMLTVTDDSGLERGNTDTDQIMVKVVESPIADAGPDKAVCAGEIVHFDGTRSRDLDGLVNTFEWDFGDGTTGGGPIPMHVYAKSGRYRVRLIITGDRMADCDNTDDDVIIVTVHAAPAAEFVCQMTAEMGKPVHFDASQTAKRISQTEKLSSVSADISASVIKWEWDFGDGTRGQGEAVEHTFEKSGDYVVTLTVTTDSGTDCNQTSGKKRVRINAPPVAEAGDAQLVGVYQVVTFDGSSSTDPDGVLSSYRWDFGDGHTDTGVQPTHQYEKPGQYEVVLTVTDNTELGNNSDTDTLAVTVNDPPKPVITINDCRLMADEQCQSSIINICEGEEATLSGRDSQDSDGEIVSYSWHFGDGSPNEKGEEVRHRWYFPGTYVLLLEIDDGRPVNNNRVQTSALVIVNDPPVANAGPDRIVSPGDDVLFDGSASRDSDGSIISFQWDFGDGVVSELKSGNPHSGKVSHLYETPGSYEAQLTVTDNSGTSCGVVGDVVNIRVNSPPVAEAGGDRETFAGGAHDAILFDATASHDPDNDPLIFYWDFGDGSSDQGAKVRHAFKKAGEYTVSLRVDDGTGVKSGVSWDKITVQVHQRK